MWRIEQTACIPLEAGGPDGTSNADTWHHYTQCRLPVKSDCVQVWIGFVAGEGKGGGGMSKRGGWIKVVTVQEIGDGVNGR